MQCTTNEKFLGLVTERAFCRKKKLAAGSTCFFIFSLSCAVLVKKLAQGYAGGDVTWPMKKHGATTAISCWHGIQDHLHHLKRPTVTTRQTRETEGERTWKKPCPASISNPRFQPTNGTAI